MAASIIIYGACLPVLHWVPFADRDSAGSLKIGQGTIPAAFTADNIERGVKDKAVGKAHKKGTRPSDCFPGVAR